MISKEVKRKILLNPGPATTTNRVKSSLVVSDICPREKEFGALFEGINKKALKVVNAEEDYESTLLGGSGTAAIESCLSSCTAPNQKILIVENGAYGKRMTEICEALGVAYEVIRFDWGEVIDWAIVEEKLSTKRFSVMATVHHETTTGILNSLSKISEICHRHHVISMVDAMSSYAGIEIDLTTTPVDYLISSSNKCIQGMAGVGIVIAKKVELERIKKIKSKSYYLDLYKNYSNQKEKKQFSFTPPVQVLYALNEAFDEFFDQGGIQERSKRYSLLYEQVYKGMTELGFKPMLAPANDSRILTTFFEPDISGFSFDQMHDYLYERNITIYPGKVSHLNTFRISNIGDLNPEDIALFLKEVENYLKTII